MEIKSQSIVGIILIVCVTAWGSCSQAIPPAFPPVPEAITPGPFSISNKLLPPVPPPYSLAILPFEDYSNRNDLGWLRQAIPDMLVTDLALLPGVRVVSRHRLGEVLREQWLQHRGAFEESASVRIGRLVGARYLLSGMYYLADGALIVEGHLVDVERGAVVRTVRVSGSPESVPSVELDLAAQLGMVFSGSSPLEDASIAEPNIAHHNANKNDGLHEKMPLADIAPDISIENDKDPYWSKPSMTFRTDTLLSMERLRDLRNAAVFLADEIWKHAVAVQIGLPQYKSLPGDTLSKARMVKVLIPVAAQIQPTWFKQTRGHLDVFEGEMIAQANTIVVAFQDQDAGAQQLFVEAMQSPRRLFVRAIGDSGEVIGVSSQWTWRMDRHVRDRSDGTIELSVAPHSLFNGSTAFPGTLIANLGAAIRFDSVIVSVPEESRVISIEPISETVPVEESEVSQVRWIPILRTWLLQRWMPPVAESIPVGGYLPGNVRRSVAVLSGAGGTVHAAQVIQREAEDGVASSIQEVISQLPGQCFAYCKGFVSKKKANPKPFQIRLQFELIKDIRFAGLNRKS